jgi:MtN3 and saliva related transmembrane protein
MDEIYVGAIGIAAGTFTTFSFVPQIVKISKTKHARDISLHMYIVMTTGTLLWLIYGILLGALPIILANSVAMMFCAYILVMKVVYSRKVAT